MATFTFYYLYFAGLAVTGILLARSITKKLLAWRAYTKAMHINGCKRVRKWPQKDPILGLDRLQRTKKGMKEGIVQEYWRQDFESCGKTFETHMFGMKMIYTMEYGNIQAVQNLESEKWGVAALRRTAVEMMGQGIFVSDNPVWSHARKTLRPIFHHSQVEDFSALEKHFKIMLKSIPMDGSTLDLQELFQRMFINFSMEYLFGETSESGIAGAQFNAAYDKAFGLVVARQGIGLPTIIDIFGKEKAMKDAMKELRLLGDAYVTAALERREERLKSEKDEPSFREGFVFLDGLVYETQNRDFVRDQLFNIFFPARDSSFIGASFIFFILARNPDVWTKLRIEAMAIEVPITRGVLRSMPYLNQVISECLRLRAPANHALRTCLKDCVLPYGGGPDGSSPIYVSAGTHIDMNFGLMHRDKDIWGADANEFKPERWATVDNPTRAKYMPFFAGPRKCPAQQILITQYSYLLVRMARLFERVDNRDEVLDFFELHKSTISSRNGVKVALIPGEGVRELS